MEMMTWWCKVSNFRLIPSDKLKVAAETQLMTLQTRISTLRIPSFAPFCKKLLGNFDCPVDSRGQLSLSQADGPVLEGFVRRIRIAFLRGVPAWTLTSCYPLTRHLQELQPRDRRAGSQLLRLQHLYLIQLPS